MDVTLRRVGGFKFEAKNPQGKTAVLDGSVNIGGSDDGIRPMEMVLMGLAGCSAFDVLIILEKARQKVKDLNISVKGERANAVPAVFTHIHLHWEATGEVQKEKLERAVALSMEKYCSASAMLSKTAKITSSCAVVDG